MPMSGYLRALARYKSVLVALALVGLAGTWGYLQWSAGASWGNFRSGGPSTAVATVAVLEPAVVKAVSGQQAQINFASVAESRTVRERVAQRLGWGPASEVPEGKVSVRLARTLVPSIPTPLYSVRVEHRDSEGALQWAHAYVEEARRLFIEMNALEPDQIDSALRAHEDRMRAELAEAREALRAFEQAHEAWQLPSQISAQVGLTTGLRQLAQISGTVTAGSGREELDEALVAAEAQRERLQALQPQYDRHSLDAMVASGLLAQLSSRETELALGMSVMGLTLPLVQLPGRDIELAFGASASTLAAIQMARSLAEENFAQARHAMVSFQGAHGIGDLSSELAATTALISELRRQSLASTVANSGFGDALTREEARLQRLRVLSPEYEQLSSAVQQAESLLTQLQLKKVDMVVGGSLPASVQVKVLDPPHIQSNLAWTFMLYVLGAALGLLGGLVVVYLLASSDRSPESVEQVEDLIGVPVLVRVPNGFSGR